MTSKSTNWKQELPQLLGLIVLLLAARSSLADHYYVPSGSMEHTLLPGDRVLVDKRAHGLRVPFTNIRLTDGEPVGRGEVVIFDSPLDGTRLIKRIVAVPGDEVLLRDGRLTINGVTLGVGGDTERFASRRARLNLNAGGGPDVYIERVPDGQLLAVGDHRGNSRDGRAFGFIAEKDVYGRAIAVYYRRNERLVWQAL